MSGTSEGWIYLAVQAAALVTTIATGVAFVVTIKGDVREQTAILQGEIDLLDERSRRNLEDLNRVIEKTEEIEEHLNDHRFSHGNN